jgi:conjugal transfer ATP-binding protein TraC
MKESNLLDELPYREVVAGTMISGDGIAEIGIRLGLKPSLTQHQDELKRLERAIQSVLRELVPEGERLRLMVRCGPSTRTSLEGYRSDSSHPEALHGEALNLVRASRLEMLERLIRDEQILTWDVCLSLTLGKSRRTTAPYFPLLLLSRIFPGLASKGFVTFDREELLELLEHGRELRGSLVAAFRGQGIEATPMDSRAVERLVFDYLNPSLHAAKLAEVVPTKFRFPEADTRRHPDLAPSSFRSQLAKIDLDNGDRHQVWLGEHAVRILGMHARPESSAFGMALELLAMNGHGWYIADFTHLEQAKTIDKLRGREGDYKGMLQSAVQLVDSNAAVAAEQLEGFNRHVTERGSHAYHVAAQLLLIDRDETRLGERVSGAISNTSAIPGSPFKLIGYNAWKHWRNGLPFSGLRMAREVFVHDGNAAAFFPPEGPWRNSQRPVSLFQSAWGTLVPIDLDDHSSLRNRNTLIVGESGSGKGILMQQILADELFAHERISYTIIEKGQSYYTFIQSLEGDGVVVPLDPDHFSLNCLDLRVGEVEPDAAKIAFVVNTIKSMIFTANEEHAAVKAAVLSAAVEQTYRRKAVKTRDASGQYQHVFRGAQLGDVRETLELMDEVNGVPMPPVARNAADEMAIKLGDWTGDSPKGRFFDRPTTIPLEDRRVVLYDTSPLEGFREMKAVAVMLMAQRITDRWNDDPGLVKRVVVDEAHDIAKLAAGFDFLDDHQRRCRAANGAQILISQTASEFVKRTEDGERSLLENISVFFVYPVSEKEDAILRSHAQMTEEAIRVVHELRSKPGEYNEVMCWMKKTTGPEGGRLRVRMSRADRAMFSSDAYDHEKRQKAVEQTGDTLEGVRQLMEVL